MHTGLLLICSMQAGVKLVTGLGLVWGIMVVAHAQSSLLHRFSFQQSKMGAPFQMILYHTDSAAAQAVAAQSFTLVDSLNALFSDYVDSSEINLLHTKPDIYSQQGTAVSAPLFAILLQAQQAWQLSQGKFDITVGPLTRLWRRARRQGVLPAEDAIRYWRSKTGFQHVKLHPHSQRLQWLTPGLQFDLGGIAQGFVVDAVAGYLRQQGISAFLVNASGDIVTQGSPPGAQDWKIAVNLPGQSHALHRKPLRLRTSGAVSTSGDALQYLEVNGNRYSHILDPVTGMGSTWQRNVTVLAQHATLADWLSTACSLLPVQEAFALAKSQQAGLLIGWVAAGNKIQWKANRLFKKYWKND